MRTGFYKTRFFAGFTIIEALVSVSVFALSMTAIVASFLAVMRLDEKSRQIRLVEQNARYVSEFLSRELRNGRLDYSAYGGSLTAASPQGKSDRLYLTNAAGEQESIYPSDVSGNYQAAGVYLALNKTGVGTTLLTSSDVGVSNLNFYVDPPSDPYPAAAPIKRQVRVTIVFTVSSTASVSITDRALINIQTTISQRYYPSS